MDKYIFLVKGINLEVATALKKEFDNFKLFDVEIIKEGEVYKMDKLEK